MTQHHLPTAEGRGVRACVRACGVFEMMMQVARYLFNLQTSIPHALSFHPSILLRTANLVSLPLSLPPSTAHVPAF